MKGYKIHLLPRLVWRQLGRKIRREITRGWRLVHQAPAVGLGQYTAFHHRNRVDPNNQESYAHLLVIAQQQGSLLHVLGGVLDIYI